MSTIKVTNLRHASATSNNIALDSSNNVTTANNFTAGGTIGCTGNLTVTSGNVVLSSGNGIDFSATSGTGTSELFDDYEEGTWTPSVSNMTTTGSPAYGGRYRKIGSQVTVWFFTTTGSGVATYASTANSTNVSGLPFASGYDGPAQSGGPPGVAINGTTSAGGFLQGPGSSGTTFYFNTTISATQGMSASLTYYV